MNPTQQLFARVYSPLNYPCKTILLHPKRQLLEAPESFTQCTKNDYII